MKRAVQVLLGAALLLVLGCKGFDLTPTSWSDDWKKPSLQGGSWKKQSGTWSSTNEGRDIERSFGFE